MKANRRWSATLHVLVRVSMGMLCVTALPAAAQQVSSAADQVTSGAGLAPSMPTAHVQNGIRYLAGGIGVDVRQRMQAASGYNLRLFFAEARDRHYVPDVTVAIRDAKGRSVLEVADAGPLFFAELPSGSYAVTVTHRGVTKTRKIEIGQGPARAHFLWEGASPSTG
jgi:hypothetical protein